MNYRLECIFKLKTIEPELSLAHAICTDELPLGVTYSIRPDRIRYCVVGSKAELRKLIDEFFEPHSVRYAGALESVKIVISPDGMKGGESL